MPSKKRPDEVDEDEELPFKLGELVLCRYSSYPYWPATVDQTHQKVSRGKFVRWGTKHDGTRILTFWCTFSNEDTGGWVRADRMVRFHPGLVDKIRVDEDHDFYNDQVTALETAEADFKKLYKDGENMPVPTPPEDFENGLDGDDDQLESVGEEETPDSEPESGRRRKSSSSRRKSTGGTVASPKESKPKPSDESRSVKRKSAPAAPPARPSKRAKSDGKKRKREQDEVMDDVDDEPPVSRKRKTSRISRRDEAGGDSGDRIKDLEDKLEDATQTITALKRRLRKRDNHIAQITDSSKPVRVVAPTAPENLAVPKRAAAKVRTNPVTAEEFAKMYKELEGCFSEFKSLVYAADDSRSALDRETKAVQEKFEKLISDVKSAEEQAAGKEKMMCSKLTDVLAADISIEALRAHKAGNYIKSMGKACKAMPLISHLCAEIRSTWLLQVKQFMKEQAAEQGKGANVAKGDAVQAEKDPKDGDKAGKSKTAVPSGKKTPNEPAAGYKEAANTGEQKSARGESSQPAKNESAEGAGSSEATGKESGAPAKESMAKAGEEVEPVKKEDKAPQGSAGSGAKSEGSKEAEGKAGDRTADDAMDVDITSAVGDKTASSAKAEDAKGEVPSASQETGEAKGSSTVPIAVAGRKDGATRVGPTTDAKSGKLGKGAEGKDSDEKDSQSSPKRQQSATTGGEESLEIDTPRSVAVPPKEEQAGKESSDVPLSGGEGSAQKPAGDTLPEKAKGKDERPNSGDKKPPSVAVGEEAATA